MECTFSKSTASNCQKTAEKFEVYLNKNLAELLEDATGEDFNVQIFLDDCENSLVVEDSSYEQIVRDYKEICWEEFSRSL